MDINIIYNKSSECMAEVSDNSIHLIVTSPPYNVGIAYDEYDDNKTIDDYFVFIKPILLECYRVLEYGGRICINIANTGRKPYIHLVSRYVYMMESIGFLMRGEIIWNKSASSGQAGSCAWGSWMSASNPCLRDLHEYILVFSKGNYQRNGKDKKSTISRDEFMDYTKSIWEFQSDGSTRKWHPAAYPIELPMRLIKLYSFDGDIILDPFMGYGTTAIAAINNNRKYIGYEISSEYVRMSNKRISDIKKNKLYYFDIF